IVVEAGPLGLPDQRDERLWPHLASLGQRLKARCVVRRRHWADVHLDALHPHRTDSSGCPAGDPRHVASSARSRPVASTSSSRKGRPTTWTPMGRPSGEEPKGTLMAGRPNRLISRQGARTSHIPCSRPATTGGGPSAGYGGTVATAITRIRCRSRN